MQHQRQGSLRVCPNRVPRILRAARAGLRRTAHARHVLCTEIAVRRGGQAAAGVPSRRLQVRAGRDDLSEECAMPQMHLQRRLGQFDRCVGEQELSPSGLWHRTAQPGSHPQGLCAGVFWREGVLSDRVPMP